MKRIELSNELKQELQNILDEFQNYHEFTQDIRAYDYAELLNQVATYCPYCNIESIQTIRGEIKEKGERMDFDHFIMQTVDKSNSMNCENLVPSCPKCNRNYKLRFKEYDKILNPFVDDFDSMVSFGFDITPQSIEEYKNAKILIKIVIKDKDLYKKTDKSIKIFNLNNRYNDLTNKNKLDEFFKFLHIYTEIRKNDLKSIKGLEQIVVDYVDKTNKAEINHTQFGKFKKDIINRYVKK